MKKKIILAFIIGAILSGTIVYAGTMIAKDITFDNTKSQLKDSNNQNVDNVQDAIDALYTKANNQTTYDEYNGSTTYTPSTSPQTVPTNNKLLKSNITINPIPASYKELATTTTATASDILSGKTAYNNLGELITGNVSTDCIGGIYNKLANSQWNIPVGFNPNRYVLYWMISNNSFYAYYESNINKSFLYNGATGNHNNDWGKTYIENNYIKSNIPTSSDFYTKSYNAYYMACR